MPLSRSKLRSASASVAWMQATNRSPSREWRRALASNTTTGASGFTGSATRNGSRRGGGPGGSTPRPA